MDNTAKIISIRQALGVPEDGFPDESTALEWYREHYKKAKGTPLRGGFGYRFEEFRRCIQFDYDYDCGSGRLSLNYIPEIVINGISLEAVKEAMKAGIQSASKVDGVVRVSAGNYGGKLGKHKIYLRELFR